MFDLQTEIDSAVDDFIAATELASAPLERRLVTLEFLPAPHRPPPSLPVGTRAVYSFWLNGACLKIGKVGPESGPRYTSQHYNLSARSTLAKSLAADARMRDFEGFDPAAPGAWIRQATSRINFLLPAAVYPGYVDFLEVFLQLRFEPRYEGRSLEGSAFET